MLEECERRRPGIHKELLELFLGRPDTFPRTLRNRFDIVTGSGIFADNHLDTKGFDEMVLSLKPGGFACFATRTEYLTKYGYGPYLKKLESEGKWKFSEEITFRRYDSNI